MALVGRLGVSVSRPVFGLSSPFGGDPRRAVGESPAPVSFRAPQQPLGSRAPSCNAPRRPVPAQVAEPRATRQAAASVGRAPGKPASLQEVRPLDPGFGSAMLR